MRAVEAVQSSGAVMTEGSIGSGPHQMGAKADEFLRLLCESPGNVDAALNRFPFALSYLLLNNRATRSHGEKVTTPIWENFIYHETQYGPGV